ncbi:MAG: hypothetical protein KF754_10860 [Planctomycetes bacterium]|nr:hypothetical protein [Planctomycetota bacterium]
MKQAPLCLVWFALITSGCAAGRSSTDVSPPGLRLPSDQAFEVRVTAEHEEQKKYTAELRALIAAELVAAGFGHAPHGMELHAHVTCIAPGGAWGEEADCRMDIALKGDNTWRFSVIGGSGSEMARDRIPAALREAARAVVERLAIHR